jgi:hypothetical protein
MQLEISSNERNALVGVVEQALSDKRVEVRRTSTPAYHDHLLAEEKLLTGLLAKLKELASLAE